MKLKEKEERLAALENERKLAEESLRAIEAEAAEVKAASVWEDTMEGKIKQQEIETFDTIEHELDVLSQVTGRAYRALIKKDGNNKYSISTENSFDTDNEPTTQRQAIRDAIIYCMTVGDWKDVGELVEWVSKQVKMVGKSLSGTKKRPW